MPNDLLELAWAWASSLRAAAVAALLLAVPFGAAAGAAGPCPDAVPPQAAQGSGWYCLTDSDTAVVFIHGLGSSNATAWQSEEVGSDGRKPYWPQLVLDDDRLGQPSVFLASFFTAIDSGSYGFERAAEDVFADLRQSFPGRPSPLDKKTILLVAHSLGGIIARQILVAHTDAFQGKRVGLLLVASPSHGSRNASDLAAIVGLTGNRMIEQLQWENADLMALDADFRRLVDERAKRLPGLVGMELMEQWALPIVPLRIALLNALYQRLGFRPVVEEQSAAVYFEDRRPIAASDHLSIARPASINARQHGALLDLLAWTAKVDTTCLAPDAMQIEFEMQAQRKVAETARSPVYALERRDRSGLLLNSLELGRDPGDGIYRASLAAKRFVCPGEAFEARLLRLPETGELLTEDGRQTHACFERARLAPADPSARLVCEEGRDCFVDPQRRGLAEACTRVVALAEMAPAVRHWAIPAIEDLVRMPAAERPGYTEFQIRSGRLAGLESATAMTAAIAVNGVPVYIGGHRPHEERFPFNGAAGVDFTFALENLGFTGGTDGYESIAAELKFYAGDELLKTSSLARGYVSYRHAKRERITDANGSDPFEWQGFYRPADQNEGYEVMLTWGDYAHVKRWKAMIDKSGWRIDGNPVVGVIRPRRRDGIAHGLILGTVLTSNSQVKSLFALDRAKELCGEVQLRDELSASIKRLAHLFRFPAATFSDVKDRGERVGSCRDM